jgi:hypothetical protein
MLLLHKVILCKNTGLQMTHNSSWINCFISQQDLPQLTSPVQFVLSLPIKFKRLVYKLIKSLYKSLNFKQPVFAYTSECMKQKLQIYFIYLGGKEIYCIFKTCHIISVLPSTKCHLCHNFIFFFCSNVHVFHKPCTAI